MNRNLRTDFENTPDGARIVLHPGDANLIQKEPMTATRYGIYFFLDGRNPERGADYYLGDVAAFCRGYEMARVTA